MTRPNAIRHIGLKKYLDDTAADHNRFDYEVFDLMMKRRVAYASLARIFNVSEPTMHKWVVIYDEEKRPKN